MKQITVEWRGKPVWVVKRTAQMLAEFPKIDGELRDPFSKVDQQPEYARNEYRSIKPELFCCSWYLYPFRLRAYLSSTTWQCRCDLARRIFLSLSWIKFDMAGRVYKGVPAPTNLEIPPY